MRREVIGDAVLYLGDCLEVAAELEDESVDAFITDGPYGLGFMGKEWDHGVPGVEFWTAFLRLAKPGAHMLSFGGTRTYHRMAMAIEDAGWEIRDQLAWVYSSGFPKSHNVAAAIDKSAGHGNRGHRIAIASRHHPDGTFEPNGDQIPAYVAKTERAKDWEGWGTALKPAWEPLCLARKPLVGTVAENVLLHSVGAINIDGCRVEVFGEEIASGNGSLGAAAVYGKMERDASTEGVNTIGRWPANIVHDGSDEVVVMFPIVESGKPVGIKAGGQGNAYGEFAGGIPVTGFGDSRSAARFFYCAKASRDDRDEGIYGSVLVVLECCLWNENTERRVQIARLQVGTEVSPPRVIVESGIGTREGREWSTTLCGKLTTGRYLQEWKSIIGTKTSSTILSKILNWLTGCITKEFTEGASLYQEAGGSLVDIVESSNQSTLSISERTASVLGVRNVASRIQLKISVGEDRNTHSTVKPTDLMRWSIRLITRPQQIVADLFMGSGSTGKAAVLEGRRFIGCDNDEKSFDIACRRIEAAWIRAQEQPALFERDEMPTVERPQGELF